jgi:hypothetical protein
VQRRPWQWLDKHLGWKANSPETGNGEAGEEQNQEHARHFFDIKRIVHKEFILTTITVNSAYYCDILRQLHEMYEDFI